MKLINSDVELWDIKHVSALSDLLKHVEKCGRVCWKSGDKITKDSYIKFTNFLKSKRHLSVFEHAPVYLFFSYISPLKDSDYIEKINILNKYKHNLFSKVSEIIKDGYLHYCYISTNLRVVYENNWEDDLKYLSNCLEHHEIRYTFFFKTDRITGESFLRHRTIQEDHSDLENLASLQINDEEFLSPTRESTRFCNYSQDKFDHNVTFVIPSKIKVEKFILDKVCALNKEDLVTTLNSDANDPIFEWLKSCYDSEQHYFNLLNLGWSPEFARYALGFSVYSPLIMSGFKSNWNHFLELRLAKSAHPDARILAEKVQSLINNRLYEDKR